MGWPANTPFTKHPVPNRPGLWYFLDNAGLLVLNKDAPPRWAATNRLGNVINPDKPYIQLDSGTHFSEEAGSLALEGIAAFLKGITGYTIATGISSITTAIAESAASAAASEVASEAAITAAETAVQQEVYVWDWLTNTASDAYDAISGWFGGAEEIAEPFGGFGDLGDLGEVAGDIGQIAGDVGQVWSGFESIFGAGGPDVIAGQRPGLPVRTGGMPIMANGDFDEGGMMPTAGLGGAMAAGGIWLGSYLARAFGRGAAGAVFQAANGIRVRMTQLWPLVRRYGPQAVAGGLGITIGGLGTLLTQAPTSGRRRRARGISARDVKTTKRTIRQLKKMARMAGIRVGGSGGGGYRPYYRPRRKQHYGWH